MKDPALWARIEAAPLPEGFAAKLAREQRWKPAFAEQAIAEYRRFVYLSQVSAAKVTPSLAVDAVWHLHLTYSRHYWEEFPKHLRHPLHHEPAGPDDPAGWYQRQYLDTLERYAAEFGARPPGAIWTEVRPKAPRWLGFAGAAAGAGLLAVGVGGHGMALALVGVLVLGISLSTIVPSSKPGAGCGSGCASSCGGGGCGD